MSVQAIDIASPEVNVCPEWGYRRDQSASIPSNRMERTESHLRPYFAGPASHRRVGRPMTGTDDTESVATFLSWITRHPAALLIEGEAGIGKTTVWLDTQEDAQRAGIRVLSTRATAAESSLDYVGLDDLLREVAAEVTDVLTTSQRKALQHVLARASGDGLDVDRRSIGAMVRAVIEELVSRTPVLLAIDDVQWIDAASREALAYALRRVQGRVGIVVTERTVPERISAAGWLDLGHPESLSRLVVGPMSLGRLHRLLSNRLGRSFPRPVMTRIMQISGGNPCYALELAHALDTAGSTRGAVLSTTLSDVTGLGTDAVDAEVGEVLLAAACVATPTVDLLATILQRPPRQIVSLLEVSENLGMVAIDAGRVRFSHPLLPHIVYSKARPADRRRVHRAVAAVEPALESRARHLALAATTGDPEILRALDSAADAAHAKAAPATAAELLELAIGLGGGTAARRISAARSHFLAGDIDRSLALAEPTSQALPAGQLRAHARIVFASALAVRGDFGRALHELRDALADAPENPVLATRIHLTAAMTLWIAGDTAGADGHAQLARERAEDCGKELLISQALAAQVLLRCAKGGGVDEVSLQRAVDLQARNDTGLDTAAPLSARIVKAVVSLWTGRLVDAHAQLAEAQLLCAASGSDVDELWVQAHAVMADIWLGRYAEASHVADDMVLGAEQLGGLPARAAAATPRALIAALQGREADARTEIAMVPQPADGAWTAPVSDGPRMGLGFLELSLGNHASALDALLPLLSRRSLDDHTEITACWFLPDLVEAAFSLGRIDEFEPWVDALEDNGARLERPWMVAIGARCRAMLLSARGELFAAERAAVRAVEAHRGLAMPFELARTQLIVGQLQRRLRQKQSARATFESALSTFEALGAPLWAARARAEVARAAAGPSQQVLTPSELRVAELAASGMTNKDVAAALYISPKTVEHNLGRIYRKLGIRNRAELGRRIDGLREGPG